MGKAPRSPAGTSIRLPALSSVDEVGRRLGLIFPETFPNRGILVGTMAERVIYVFLYGGFVEGHDRYLRPSHVYFFTKTQAEKTGPAEREKWVSLAVRPGFRPKGERWYADTSRESIRDDLIRNELLRLGLVQKVPGLPITSSKPIYFLSTPFAALFDPALSPQHCEEAIRIWQQEHLDPATLQRMALRAAGVEMRQGEVLVDLPEGSRIRIAAGPSSIIVKGLIENFARRHLKRPAILWLSGSDKKLNPHFIELSRSVGLEFDASAELPDVIVADLEPPLRVFLCEVVATDGAVTEGRKVALLARIKLSNVPQSSVRFLSAFEDREADAFRKNFSKLAVASLVWFRTEPDLVVILRKNGRHGLELNQVHPDM